MIYRMLFGVCGVMYVEDKCSELRSTLLSDDVVCIVNCCLVMHFIHLLNLLAPEFYI
jgi:hypothetical protein